MHQPFDGASCDHKALPHHLPPDFAHAASREVHGEHTGYLGFEGDILPRLRRQARWIPSLRDVFVVGGWGVRQDKADRFDA
ncbi:hypothetical protein ASF00_07535 [Sphingomonas sp. Leaf34]|uniref:hypothetical protein n=1 Tax=Sphingomonas sp. Leaf34 TaxID=1736216 RepID=UPI0006FB2C75|nr:hypothetical protein ASF00_07535 [Sphingomonas sp. Leaf34]